MCIVLFTTAHPDYALIIVNNRDEYVLRPTSRPHWWTHPASGNAILSSRDLQRDEKGTWFGITKTGSFAVLTNYRETDAKNANHPISGIKSRGGMVTAWLGGQPGSSIKEDIHQLMQKEGVQGVGGFSMICGKMTRHEQRVAIVSNRAATVDDVPLVGQGRDQVWGLSNTVFEMEGDKWPKVEAGEKLLRDAISRNSSQEELIVKLFSLLDTDMLPKQDPHASFAEYISLLKHSIFIPAIGDPTHRKAMRTAISKAQTAAATSDERLAMKEPASGQQPDGDQSRDPGMSFNTGIYGTQRQTVLLVDFEGNTTFIERALWDENGLDIPRGQGDVIVHFKIEGWGDATEDN